ncbi:peptide ABC transporter substrate-binding protein [Luteolibacter pohnpeiensis]|uniref:Peptide ABC transporter substrate-binding protein n=1 Tax=Luteolibacter pohnpeiensis TaxID=454153 RepID=A0A934VWL0_9BACT|nr:peptide ABC transporter substrate-binding protein [Luteolibacter pohnpeiensis]MBK1882923.1 peptide ABC transporter substrate-binding protein [Luteolibacter pohnpeiensis]
MLRRLIILLLPALGFLVSCQKETQVERANREGIFLTGNSAEPKSLDLQQVTGVPEGKIITSLFEGLVADDPENDDGTPPGAATSWEHNDDLTEWTFHLQPEGRWSDGVPVTADDFVFAYNRLLHPDFAGPYAEMLYFLKNAEEFNKGKITDFSQVGVKAIDDHTLFVKLREPVPFLPSLTRHYTWFPVPKHVILKFGKMQDRFTDWSVLPNMVGNGPFKLKTWRFHDVIEVERNTYYWDAKNVGLNGIRFFPIENPFTETRAFLSGQLHNIYTLPSDLIPAAKKEYPQYLHQEPYVGTVFVRLNTTRKGLDNEKVRNALSLALDRESICKYIMEGYTPTTSFVPKMGAYEPEPVLSFNPEKARALLAEAGYPDGKGFPRFSVLISKPDAKASIEAMQAMWRKHLNILVDIQIKDWGSFVTAQQNLDFDIAVGGWIGDYLDPTTFLNLWTKGNGNNNTGWSDPAYEALLSEAALTADAAKRLEILKRAELMVMKAQPIIPVSWYSRNYLLRPEVKGWHPLLLDNHPWKSIRLEK